MTEARTLVIGIGHPDRGDDAVGRVVAAKLRTRAPKGVRVIEEDGEATSLVDKLGGARNVIIVDASLSGGRPGTIRRFDAVRESLPKQKFGMSTHGFGLGEAIELARALGQLPERCVIFAIEAASFELGRGLSPVVAAAVDEVVERVLAEILVEA